MCVCVCVCACVRACVRVCVCVCVFMKESELRDAIVYTVGIEVCVITTIPPAGSAYGTTPLSQRTCSWARSCDSHVISHVIAPIV